MRKTQLVAEIVNQLGFCNEIDAEKLPKDWQAEVEKALKAKGIEVHESTIRFIRHAEAVMQWRDRQAAANNALQP